MGGTLLDFGGKTPEEIREILSDPYSDEFGQFVSHCYLLTKKYHQPTADICQEYLEAGADPTIPGKDGVIVPLLCFAEACAAELLQLCVKNRKRYIKQFYEVLDSSGKNALHLCAQSKPESAPDPTIQEKRFVATVMVLCDEMGFCMTNKDMNGNTPVHLAIITKSQPAVEYCINAFISRDTTRSPLQIYPLKEITSAEDVTDTVIDHYQSFYPHSKNNDGNSLWMMAVKEGILNPKIYEAIYLLDNIKQTTDTEGKNIFHHAKSENENIAKAATLALRLFDSFQSRDRINAIIKSTNEKTESNNPFNFTYKNLFHVNLEGDIHELTDGKDGFVKLVKHDLNPRVVEHPTPSGPMQKTRVFNYVFNIATSKHIHTQEVPSIIELDIGCKNIPGFEDVPVILIDYHIRDRLIDQLLSEEGNKEAIDRLKQNAYLQVHQYPAKTSPWRLISQNHTCNNTWHSGEIDDPGPIMTISMIEYDLVIKRAEREKLAPDDPAIEMIDKIIAAKEEEMAKAVELMNQRTIKYELLGFFVTINVSIQKML